MAINEQASLGFMLGKESIETLERDAQSIWEASQKHPENEGRIYLQRISANVYEKARAIRFQILDFT